MVIRDGDHPSGGGAQSDSVSAHRRPERVGDLWRTGPDACPAARPDSLGDAAPDARPDAGSPWYVSGMSDPRFNDDVLHELDRFTGADLQTVDTTGLVSTP